MPQETRDSATGSFPRRTCTRRAQSLEWWEEIDTAERDFYSRRTGLDTYLPHEKSSRRTLYEDDVTDSQLEDSDGQTTRKANPVPVLGLTTATPSPPNHRTHRNVFRRSLMLQECEEEVSRRIAKRRQEVGLYEQTRRKVEKRFDSLYASSAEGGEAESGDILELSDTLSRCGLSGQESNLAAGVVERTLSEHPRRIRTRPRPKRPGNQEEADADVKPEITLGDIIEKLETMNVRQHGHADEGAKHVNASRKQWLDALRTLEGLDAWGKHVHWNMNRSRNEFYEMIRWVDSDYQETVGRATVEQ